MTFDIFYQMILEGLQERDRYVFRQMESLDINQELIWQEEFRNEKRANSVKVHFLLYELFTEISTAPFPDKEALMSRTKDLIDDELGFARREILGAVETLSKSLLSKSSVQPPIIFNLPEIETEAHHIQDPIQPQLESETEKVSAISWESITIRFRDYESIAIGIPGRGNPKITNYTEMKMSDGRNQKPKQAWITLVRMALKTSGQDWVPHDRDGGIKSGGSLYSPKDIQELRKALKDGFKKIGISMIETQSPIRSKAGKEYYQPVFNLDGKSLDEYFPDWFLKKRK